MIREFRLSPPGKREGVSCDEDGAFVGAIPLLKRSAANGKDYWQPIDAEQLSAEFSSEFGLPVDMSRKMGGLKTIAKALNTGDVARAQIATVAASRLVSVKRNAKLCSIRICTFADRCGTNGRTKFAEQARTKDSQRASEENHYRR